MEPLSCFAVLVEIGLKFRERYANHRGMLKFISYPGVIPQVREVLTFLRSTGVHHLRKTNSDSDVGDLPDLPCCADLGRCSALVASEQKTEMRGAIRERKSLLRARTAIEDCHASRVTKLPLIW